MPPPQPSVVHYVLVPADVHQPLEERSLAVEGGREVEGLLDAIKAHLRAVGGPKTQAQRQAQEQQLRARVGAEVANKLSIDMLDTAMDIGLVETIALLTNNAASGYVAVNMYCDDQAQIKQLPHNTRATQITDTCGRLVEVRGDVFLGRIFDNEDDFVRMDFRLDEVSSTAPWVAQARAQAERARSQGDTAQAFMDKIAAQKAAQKAAQGAARKGSPPSARVVELSPAEAAKEEGNAAFQAKDYQAAVAAYTRALAAAPGLSAALNNRALCLLKLGRHAEAVEDCTQVLTCEPCNVKALMRRASGHEAAGDAAAAAADCARVLQLEPHNRDAQAILARLPPPQPPLPHGSLQAEAPPGEPPIAETGPAGGSQVSSPLAPPPATDAPLRAMDVALMGASLAPQAPCDPMQAEALQAEALQAEAMQAEAMQVEPHA